MTEDPRPSASTRSFEEKYVRFRSPEGRAVARAALGTDLANGYTTKDQAAALAGHLGVGTGDRLLDLGAGRGWPGSFIAETTGCGLVCTDLPMEALSSAQENIGALQLDASATVLVADGRMLPFRDAVFEAVCHADVLC